MKPKVTVEEARQILGKDAESMTNAEIAFTIETLDLMAKDALNISEEDLHRKRDAYRMAQLTYDIYIDKKKSK